MKGKTVYFITIANCLLVFYFGYQLYRLKSGNQQVFPPLEQASQAASMTPEDLTTTARQLTEADHPADRITLMNKLLSHPRDAASGAGIVENYYIKRSFEDHASPEDSLCLEMLLCQYLAGLPQGSLALLNTLDKQAFDSSLPIWRRDISLRLSLILWDKNLKLPGDKNAPLRKAGHQALQRLWSCLWSGNFPTLQATLLENAPLLLSSQPTPISNTDIRNKCLAILQKTSSPEWLRLYALQALAQTTPQNEWPLLEPALSQPGPSRNYEILRRRLLAQSSRFDGLASLSKERDPSLIYEDINLILMPPQPALHQEGSPTAATGTR